MKNSNFPTLTTPYADRMDRNDPWNEYPRPSMVRDSFLSLNGLWDFSVTDGSDAQYTDKILVPFPPESLLSGYEKEIPKGSVMYYRRTVEIPDGFINNSVILHFGAVDTVCDVFIDGTEVIHHEGGYLPFSVDVTDYAKNGSFSLSVRVIDDLNKIYPYGKQKRKRGGMWYTPVSGIWQTVWLESLPEAAITGLKITPTMSNVTVEVLGGEDKKHLILEDGSVYEFSGSTVTLTPKETVLWSPENPKLYNFALESGDDRIESYFALREISVGEVNGIPRILLNGEPYLFNGLLDQGYYPDGIFLPATSKGYEEDILAAKRLGFNMLRKHIKIEPEIFYHLCDRLGMVVFQDMVNNSGYSFILDTALPTVGIKRLPDMLRHKDRTSRRIFKEHMKETMEHLYNFPSILYYTVFNEGWGQFCADDMYRYAKECDSTRIIDATSGWFVQKESDVDSRHVYFKAVKLGKVSNRPIVISEFGGYSHRVKEHLFGSDNYGYRIFESREEFEDAFIKLYSEEILPLIPSGICALVYTQLSDVEDETNGLLTYDRRILKVNADRISSLMSKLAESIRNP